MTAGSARQLSLANFKNIQRGFQIYSVHLNSRSER